MLSNGEAHVIADFDARLAKYALGQLGVTTNELFVSQVHDGNDLVCQLDEVNHWYTTEWSYYARVQFYAVDDQKHHNQWLEVDFR